MDFTNSFTNYFFSIKYFKLLYLKYKNTTIRISNINKRSHQFDFFISILYYIKVEIYLSFYKEFNEYIFDKYYLSDEFLIKTLKLFLNFEIDQINNFINNKNLNTTEYKIYNCIYNIISNISDLKINLFKDNYNFFSKNLDDLFFNHTKKYDFILFFFNMYKIHFYIFYKMELIIKYNKIDANLKFFKNLDSFSSFVKILNISSQESIWFNTFKLKVFFNFLNYYENLYFSEIHYSTDMFDFEKDKYDILSNQINLSKKHYYDYNYNIIWNFITNDFIFMLKFLIEDLKINLNFETYSNLSFNENEFLEIMLFLENFDLDSLNLFFLKKRKTFFKDIKIKSLQTCYNLDSDFNVNINQKKLDKILESFFKPLILKKDLQSFYSTEVNKLIKKKEIKNKNSLKKTKEKNTSIKYDLKFNNFNLYLVNKILSLKFKSMKNLFESINKNIFLKNEPFKKLSLNYDNKPKLIDEHFYKKDLSYIINSLNNNYFFKKKPTLVFYKNYFKINLSNINNLDNESKNQFFLNFKIFSFSKKSEINLNSIKNNFIKNYYYSNGFMLVKNNVKNIYHSHLKSQSLNFLKRKLNVNFIINTDLFEFNNKLINNKKNINVFFLNNFDIELKLINKLNNLNSFFIKNKISFPEFDLFYNFLINILTNKLSSEFKFEDFFNKLKFILIISKKFNDDFLNSFFKEELKKDTIFNKILGFKNAKLLLTNQNINKIKLFHISELYSFISKIFSDYLFFELYYFYSSNFKKFNFLLQFPFYLDFRGRVYNEENIFSPTGNKKFRNFFNFEKTNHSDMIYVLKNYNINNFIIKKYKYNFKEIILFLDVLFKTNKFKKLNFDLIDYDYNFIFLNSMFWLLFDMYKYFLPKKDKFSYLNLDLNIFEFIKKFKNEFEILILFIDTNDISTKDKNSFQSKFNDLFKLIYNKDEDEFFSFFNSFIQLKNLFTIHNYTPNSCMFKDASANVYQHLLCISKNKKNNKILEKKFNLANDDQYNDPYVFLINYLKCESKLHELVELYFFEFVLLKSERKNLFSFLYSRKFLKIILMTFSYKSTLDKWKKEIYEHNDFINFLEELINFCYKPHFLDKIFEENQSYFLINLNSFIQDYLDFLKKNLTNFFEENFLINVFNLIKVDPQHFEKNINKNNEKGICFEFSDFNSNLSYFLIKKQQSKDSLILKKNNIERLSFNLFEKPNVRKMNTALLANFIHSIDSYIARQMHIKIENMTTLHDSFGTYPCFQDILLIEYKNIINDFYQNQFPIQFSKFLENLNIINPIYKDYFLNYSFSDSNSDYILI